MGIGLDALRRASRKTLEVRKRWGWGVGKALTGPETQPPLGPTRLRGCSIALTPSVHEGRSARRRHCAEACAGRRAAGPSSSTPPRSVSRPAPAAALGAEPGTPGKGHTGDGLRWAPSASAPSTRPQRGGGMPGGEDTVTQARGGQTGARPMLGRAHRSEAPPGVTGAPLIQHATGGRQRRTGGGLKEQRIGAAAAREVDTRARPGEQQIPRMREVTLTERHHWERGHARPTPREPAQRVERRARHQARELLGSTGRRAGCSCGPTAGSHCQRPPSTGAVLRHAREDGLAPPSSRGARAHRRRHTQSRSRPG